jgi:hypothetical protein
MNQLHVRLSKYWQSIQQNLFPWLSETLGELSEKQRKLITVLEMVRIEEFVHYNRAFTGHPPADRVAIARAFVAKAVYNIDTTRALLDRLHSDVSLRRICGWERKDQIPHESTFSRAFTWFSETMVPLRVHEAMIKIYQSNRLVGHMSRDSTEIVGREKPTKKKNKMEKKVKGKRGRPRKGEERKKEPTRLERQCSMTFSEMVDDLPKDCDVGSKKNSKGYKETWIGYKLHIDVADGQIPISCILTSASLHDSQAAIPLAEMTRQRVTNLYDLMDSAYDSPIIRTHCQSLGHVPIIDINPRRNNELKEELNAELQRRTVLNLTFPEERRYQERTAVERVNGRLKDEFGGKNVRVRGHAKVLTHLMFGILALTADQLLRLL